MDFVAVLLIELVYAVSNLILIGLGLAVMFGMMRVINLAHGEFMMLGGYVTIVSVQNGISIFIAMLVLSPLLVGLFGLLCERLIIRHLYGRLIDTMLASWGLSLLIIGLVTIVFGNTITGVSAPISGFVLGEYQINGYNFFIIVMTLFLLLFMYVVLKWTKIGLIARGAMENSDMTSAMGFNPDRIYMFTFFIGSALSGLAGAILSPIIGVVPTSGGIYIAKAFITVIVGGPAVVTGLLSSATLLGLVNQFFTFVQTSVIGELSILVVAVILLRIFPKGITGYYFKGRM